MTLTARDYFENPGLITFGQALALSNAGLADEQGVTFPVRQVPLFGGLMRLGFLYITYDRDGTAHAHLTSAGGYMCELVAARVDTIAGKRAALRVVRGGKA